MRGKDARMRDLEALYHAAVGAVQERRIDEAIRHFNSLLRLTSEGRVRVADGRSKGARRLPVRLRQHFHTHTALAAACRMNLAACYVEKGMLREAITELEAAVKLEPHNWQAAWQLGYAYERDGQSAKAMQQFRVAVRSAARCAATGDEPQTYQLDGVRYARAMRECATATQMDNSCASAKADLAIALKRCGQLDEALSAAEALGGQLPDDAERVHELAELWLANDQPQKAVQALQPLLSAGRHYEPAVRTLAEAYLTLAEYEKAARTCAKSRATGGARLPVLDLLLAAYERIGDIPKALACATDLVQTAPLDPYAHFRLGAILQRNGDFANAMTRYSMAFDLAPQHDQVRESAAEAMETLDAIQLQQIVALAAANVVFRAKLRRDSDEALREHGFRLTDAAMSMLESLDMDDLTRGAGHIDRRMTH